MKIKIEKNFLDNIISSMQPFIDKKDASSITSHIYLDASNNNLLIKATDYEIGLISNINNINIVEEGKATINGINFLNIIKRLKNEEITLSTFNDNFLISQNKSKFKLPMFNPEEYPLSENFNNLKELPISILKFIESIKKITPAVATNNPKIELNNALIDIKNSIISIVGTDTRRLALVEIDNINNIEENQIIIPKKSLLEIQKIFFENAKIFYDETYLIIKNEKNLFYTKLTNGTYPNYKRIIPTEFKYKINLPKNQLIESIKLVTSLFDSVKIIFSNKEIYIESLDEDNESNTQFDIDLNIEEEFELSFKSSHLLDFLNVSINNQIILGYNDSNLPFYLEDGKLITIIMPISN